MIMLIIHCIHRSGAEPVFKFPSSCMLFVQTLPSVDAAQQQRRQSTVDEPRYQEQGSQKQ